LAALNWAVFVSGSGSNLRAILDMHRALNVRLLVTQRKLAYGVKRARRAGVPVWHFDKDKTWNQLDAYLNERGVNAIFLAGFMKILPADFVSKWNRRIINVHPSLLPLFPGVSSIQRSFESEFAMGVTIHEVNEIVDGGKVLIQRQVRKSEKIEEAERLVHLKEHQLVQKVVEAWIPEQM